MNKRRSSNRVRTLLNARIVFNDRFSLIECTVRNLSETGARITFPHPIDVPPEFELEIPSRRMSVRAKVVWSNGKEHGVMFIEGMQDAAISSLPRHTVYQEQIASEAKKHGVREIVNEARHRIAQVMELPLEAVKLKLEITN